MTHGLTVVFVLKFQTGIRLCLADCERRNHSNTKVQYTSVLLHGQKGCEDRGTLGKPWGYNLLSDGLRVTTCTAMFVMFTLKLVPTKTIAAAESIHNLAFSNW